MIVSCASFFSYGFNDHESCGLNAHDGRLLECVAARLVGEGQVELELRTAAPKEQFEVLHDQPHRRLTS